VLPKPGVVLVKIQSDPRVYALENNLEDVYSPVLREIASESIARAMYGEAWADYVIDIEPTFFTKSDFSTVVFKNNTVISVFVCIH
jgi:hypothetical protein